MFKIFDDDDINLEFSGILNLSLSTFTVAGLVRHEPEAIVAVH